MKHNIFLIMMIILLCSCSTSLDSSVSESPIPTVTPVTTLKELDYLIYENITFDEIISTYGKPFDWEYVDDYSGYYTITYSDLEFTVYNSDDLTTQYVGDIHLPKNNIAHSICGFYIGQPIKELTNSIGNLHIYTDYEYTDNIWEDNLITYQIGDLDCYINIAVDETKIIDIKYYIPV